MDTKVFRNIQFCLARVSACEYTRAHDCLWMVVWEQGKWERGSKLSDGEGKIPSHGERFYCVSKSPYFLFDLSLMDGLSSESLHPGGCAVFLIIRMSFTMSTT